MWDVLNFLTEQTAFRFVMIFWLATIAVRLWVYRNHLKARKARTLYTPTKAEARTHEEIADLKRKYDDLVDGLGTVTNLAKHCDREIVQQAFEGKERDEWLESMQKRFDEVAFPHEMSRDTDEIKPDIPTFFEASILDLLRRHHADTWDEDLRTEFLDQASALIERQYARQCAREGRKALYERKRKTGLANLSVLGDNGEEQIVSVTGIQDPTPALRCIGCGSHSIRGGHPRDGSGTVYICNDCGGSWGTCK